MICVKSTSPFVLLCGDDFSSFSFRRVVKVLRFYSIQKQRQVSEQKDCEDKGNR